MNSYSARRNHFTFTWFMIAVLCALSLATPIHALAQDASATPTEGAGTPTVPEDLKAFEIYPKGKMLGDYFASTIDAGDKAKLVVVLANTGNVVFNGRTYATNAHSAVNGGFEVAESGEESTGVTLWLDYPEKVYAIDPGTGIEVTFTVSVPKDTPPGQYITSLVLEDAEPLAVEGSDNFKQLIRFPVPVFITVPGKVTPGFEIGDPAVSTTQSTTEISIPIHNTGNVRVRPTGNVSVQDSAGNELYNIPVGMGSVYAHDQTSLHISIPAILSDGDYALVVDLEDPDTKVSVAQALSFAGVAAATPVAASPVQIIEATGIPAPDLAGIQFLDINVRINNDGDALTGGQVILHVAHDGEPVEDFALGSSLSIGAGETAVQARYIPAIGWSKGIWTFDLSVEAVDAGTGVAKVLATGSIASIEIPK